MVKNIDVLNVSMRLAELIAESAYAVWQDQKFRSIIDFEGHSQIEQDRIFNELEVTIIGLWHLYLDSLHKKPGFSNQRRTLKSLKEEIIKQFLNLYRNLKVEESFIRQWEMLINMRLEEYKHDYSILLTESKNIKALAKDDLEFRSSWARVETLTLDAVSHIRKGELEKDDPLLQFVQLWVITVDTDFAKFCSRLFFEPLGES